MLCFPIKLAPSIQHSNPPKNEVYKKSFAHCPTPRFSYQMRRDQDEQLQRQEDERTRQLDSLLPLTSVSAAGLTSSSGSGKKRWEEGIQRIAFPLNYPTCTLCTFFLGGGQQYRPKLFLPLRFFSLKK